MCEAQIIPSALGSQYFNIVGTVRV